MADWHTSRLVERIGTCSGPSHSGAPSNSAQNRTAARRVCIGSGRRVSAESSFSYAFAFSFAFGWGVFNSGFGARLAEAHNRSSSYRRSTDCGALKTTAAAIGVFAGRIQGTTGSLARQGNETSIRNEYEYGEAENGSELGNLHDGELVRFGMAGENIWSQSSAI